MGRDGRNHAARIIGLHGKEITLDDLPPAGVTRWGCHRKAMVVLAVFGGLLTIDEACHRYQMSVEEFLSWESGYLNYGLDGVKVGASQHYRRSGSAALRRTHTQPDGMAVPPAATYQM